MVLQPVEVAQAAKQCQDWDEVLTLLRQLLHTHGNSLQQWQPETQEAVLALALGALNAGDFATRWQVAKLLPALGPVAIPPLIDILQDEDADPEERWFAGRLLGEFHGKPIIQSLVRIVQQSSDPELAAITAQALANQGQAAIAPLSTLLEQPSTALLAIHALAQIADGGVVAPLLSVTNHADPDIRSAALLALSNFRDERVLAVLKAAAQDRATVVRRAAATGLGRWATPATEADLLSVLAPLLQDWQLSVCEQAILAIGRLQTNEAARLLAAELRSPGVPLPLQITLIRALVWTETALALTLLQDALAHLSMEVLAEAIQVMGRISNKALQAQAASILVNFGMDHTAANDLPPSVLQALAHAMALLGAAQAIPILNHLKEHPDSQVALHAEAALGQLG
jgi:HEAT repeat protein